MMMMMMMMMMVLYGSELPLSRLATFPLGKKRPAPVG
jgi:hypothetical protein